MPFQCGVTLEETIRQERFDLLLMRWDGKGLSGIALAHRLRGRMAPAPGMVLLLDESAPGGIAELADAALPDPCNAGDLLACVDALAARRGIGRGQQFIGELRFDDTATIVEVNGLPVQLTSKEYALAQLLMRHVGQPLSRDDIMAAVWGRRENPGSRTLDAHIAQVRKRLLLRPDHGWRLSSVYGFGYRLDRVPGSVTDRVSAARP